MPVEWLIARLDDLEPLVHHRRRVDRDLGTHVPVGVRRRLLAHGLGLGLVERQQLLGREVAEGAARRGEDDAAERVGRHALQALEDRRVLRVGGRHHRAVLLEQWEDDRPARDERLLVGQRDRAAQLDRLDRRQQPGDADHARYHRVGARRHGRRNLAVGASDDLRRFHASGLQPFAQLALLLRCCQADDLVGRRARMRVSAWAMHSVQGLATLILALAQDLGLELSDLLGEELDVGAR